jgi:hypothetical protein
LQKTSPRTRKNEGNPNLIALLKSKEINNGMKSPIKPNVIKMIEYFDRKVIIFLFFFKKITPIKTPNKNSIKITSIVNDNKIKKIETNMIKIIVLFLNKIIKKPKNI